MRFGVTGGLLLQVPGKDTAAKADLFAGRLREVFSGGDVVVSRPRKTMELRLRGTMGEETASREEILEALGSLGGCDAGDIRIGSVRPLPRSPLSTLWVRCPLAVGRKALSTGRLRVGWNTLEVEALRARPLRSSTDLPAGSVDRNTTVPRSRTEDEVEDQLIQLDIAWEELGEDDDPTIS
ncbi:uncharacterized protein LOC114935088 [Nylanderia fulva]|uniref:uncharacterized protein LOC114935088 n=1 Tax=Nylanderia fulva TaxID=613905 RepID=UPI0010FB1B36|nr:uncharacterized protein LOC114935088 [Nylanderia fulva]